MDIEGCDAGEIMAEFASLQRDSKKTALKFNIKGDSEEKAIPLYRFAGRNVTLNLQASQMSIEDYYDEPREGLEYKVNLDGTVDVEGDPNQVTMDEAVAAADEASASDKVTPIDSKRSRKKKGDEDKSEQLPFADDEDTLPDADDGFPF
jgi:hypothetical protein